MSVDAALSAAFAAADVLVRQARTQAAKGPTPSESGGLSPVWTLSRAREQERHNTGWVYSSIRAIASRISGQPIRVGRKTAKRPVPRQRALDVAPGWVKQLDNIEVLERHPLLDALADPNPLHVQWSLLFLTVAGLELTGRAYWMLSEGQAGATEIWPLPASWVRPLNEPGRWNASYEVQPRHGAEPFQVPGEAMLAFSYPDPADPLYGAASPLQALAGAVSADEAITEAQRRTFAQGYWPGLAITMARNVSPSGQEGTRPILTKEQRGQILSAVREAYEGVARFGEPIILDGLIERVDKLSNSPAEMDFRDSGGYTKSRITQGFGVSPIVLGEIEGANRASATVADEHFCNTLNPKIELLSQVMTGWFAPHYGDPDLLVWLEECRAKDVDAERADWQQAIGAGAVTRDEVRARLGLAPLGKDKGGDDLVKPAAQGNGGSKRARPFRGKGTEESKPSRTPRYLDSNAPPHRNGNGIVFK